MGIERNWFRLTFDEGTLALEGSVTNKDQLEALFGPKIWTWDHRILKWRSDAYHHQHVQKVLRVLADQNVRVESQVHQPDASGPSVIATFCGQRNLPSPRPEQQKAIESWSATKRGIVVMPTGTGKTEVALSIISKSAIPT